MHQQIEIEFKTLLSQQDYLRLLLFFNFKENDFVIQDNDYFDTLDYQLKKQRIGLRVRRYATQAILTLKIPHPTGLLEISDTLSLTQANQIIQTNQLPNQGSVAKKLADLHINRSDLQRIGHLKTKRAEKKIPEGLLALDESWYNQGHDFELELEVDHMVRGKAAFQNLLKTLNIKLISAPNKIQRMMQHQTTND